jgi:peptide/nickel transport system substrate-binding protein
MKMVWRALLLGCLFATPSAAVEFRLREAPMLSERVAKGELPPLIDRLPQTMLLVEPRNGRSLGVYGGELRTLAVRARDLRYISANSYTRLVGYNEELELVPDLAESLETDGRRFTFTLRAGHRWSDGSPFTTEDFRYWWEDIANNKELSPSGPPDSLMVNGKPPRVIFLDERRVRFEWDSPNPRFLPALAAPRPLTVFAPSAYLKNFHARYTDRQTLDQLAARAKLKSWATLHNRLDDPYEQGNHLMPTLAAWRNTTEQPATRFVFERNPYYHRIDASGQQLPYIDQIIIDTSAAGLFAAKANAGDVDLLARGLSMSDVPVLKQGEKDNPYRTLLWPEARGSAYALYPNITTNDPVWRALNRDVRFRRALSLGIDRRIINNALLFGLGTESNNTVLPESTLYEDRFRTVWMRHDVREANRLLDEIGLTRRDSLGYRLLPDGRTAEIIVEVDGEAADLVDALQLIAEFWVDIGIKLFVKPQERTILRQRAYAGQTIMVAAPGLDNAIPTEQMPPNELAPVRQDHYSWPKWGQFVETRGKSGEAPDLAEARALVALYQDWMATTDEEQQRAIWSQMLAINSEQQFTIGTVTGQLQPIVVARALHNIPERAIFSWEPTSLLGIYRIDQFYYAR